MWSTDTSTFVAALAQVATALVALAAAVFAWRQVGEARRLREEQSKPFVVVDVVPGRPWMNWLTLVIENIGATLAREVHLEFTPPLTTTIRDGGLERSALIVEGIAALPPSRRIETLFDLSHDRLEQQLPMRYEILVRYRDSKNRPMESLPFTLDFAYICSLKINRERSTHDLAVELEKLNKELAQWRDGERGLLIRRPGDNRRRSNDDNWMYALSGKRRSMAHPRLVFGWSWLGRIPFMREPLLEWRRRRDKRQRAPRQEARQHVQTGPES